MQSPALGHPGSQRAALHLPHCLPLLPPPPRLDSIPAPGPCTPPVCWDLLLAQVPRLCCGAGGGQGTSRASPLPPHCHPSMLQCPEQPLGKWPGWHGMGEWGRGGAASVPPGVQPGVWWALPSPHTATDLHFVWEVAADAGTDAPTTPSPPASQCVAVAAAPKTPGDVGTCASPLPPQPELTALSVQLFPTVGFGMQKRGWRGW